MAYISKFQIWLLLNCFINQVYLYIPYKDQARLLSENGHLYIESAEGGNITLKTRGGYININEENLLQVTFLARKAATAIEKFETESLTEIQTSINDISSTVRGPMLRRLERLETFLPNSTSAANYPTPFNIQVFRGRIRILTRRVNLLSNQVRTMRRNLLRDECDTNPCKNGGTCFDEFIGFHCICPPQWEGKRCDVDVDECERFKGTDLGCQNGATCQNTDGGYNCLCPTNWFGLHCTRRTYDCTAQDSAEICGHGICINQGGTGRGFTCICYQGWTSDPGTGACTKDVDECARPVSPCSHDPPVACVNLPGSFTCNACPPGYSGNGYQCVDIDECQINNGGCSTQPQVQCINTRGSYVCGPCPPGYSGDGKTCEVTSPCSVNNGGCNDLATCTYVSSLNYVQCKCLHGWTGSGIGPTGCTQITNASYALPCTNNPCSNGGTCVPLGVGRFRCICLPPYAGSTCELSIEQPCLSNPCQNGGSCTNLRNGNYSCLCYSGYTGRNCEQHNAGCVGRYIASNGTISWPVSSLTQITSENRLFVCNWLISSENRSLVVKIEFTKINIQKLYNRCSFNYIEVYNGRSSSYPSLGKFCGTTLPDPIVSSHPELYIVYKSFFATPGEFSLNWTTVQPECGGTLNASRHGILSSPGSPGPYPHNAECEWHLIAPEGKRIQISFFSLDIEIHANCSWDYLEILDGPSLSSPLLRKFCNSSQPSPITTSSNIAVIHFHSDHAGNGKGFQITFTPIEGIPGCGGVLTASSGRITPPLSIEEENSYRENVNCEWKIEMPYGEKIQLTFEKLQLEHSYNCKYDSIAVYDGPSTDSKLFGKWCGDDRPEAIVSSSNTLTIEFITDYTYNEGGFIISYLTACGGRYNDPTGIIKSPYYPRHYPGDRVCTYLIEQPPGNVIVLKFSDVDIEEDTDDECLYDSLKIFDGNTQSSPLIAELCGNNTISTTISKHNFLYLVFTTDDTRHGRGFYANYSSLEIGCGGILTGTSGFVSSPKYPDEYPENKVCHWIISAKPGFLIQLTWIAFSLEGSAECIHDWIKIYDNTTRPDDAFQIGQTYCGKSLPPSMTSASNIIMIEFESDSSVGESGFMASYTVIDARKACGGNYFASSGTIKSPNYPNEYPDGLDCSWVITVPDGRQIQLNITDFELEKFTFKCTDDYLEIRNGGYETSPLINRYCGIEIDNIITSMSNQIYLRFVSDQAFGMKGFLIKWDSSLRGCGGTLSGQSGDIISPNYPSPYGRNAECFWRISVSQGSLIKLVILDIDLEENDNCQLDFLEIRDGTDKRANLIGKYCKEEPMTTITSTANHLYLIFRSDLSNEGRGFHVKFATECNRTLNSFHGVIESPNFPNNEKNEINCNWIIEAPKGNQINITFSHFELIDHPLVSLMRRYGEMSLIEDTTTENTTCAETYIKISAGSENNAPSIDKGKFCGSQIPAPINSPLDHVYVQFKSAELSLANVFRLEWMVSGCGGHISGKPWGELTSPGYPNGYDRAYVCEWYVSVVYGNSIKITIDELHMEKSEDCMFDSIKVYGGADNKAPLLVSRCDSFTEPLIATTSGSKAFIRFESDSSIHGKGFHATYQAIPNKECGGEFSGSDGQIHSPNYPRNYGAFDDCSFTIRVDRGLRIVLNFTDFDIFTNSLDDDKCDSSYVAIYDGYSELGNKLGLFCGNRIPPSVISTTNQIYIRFKSDGLHTAKGFIATYYTDCGATLSTDSDGVITYSDLTTRLYRTKELNACSWTIKSTKLDSKITLNFVQLEIGSENNDTDFGLKIYAGEDSTAPFLSSYSGSWSPSPILVPSSAVTIRYEWNNNYYHTARFIIHYSVLDTACGGSLLSESGTFVSPKYPDNYPPNTECVWQISTSPGNRMILDIIEIDIEQSDSCNSDYLEVREQNKAGKLIGAYCGSVKPERLYSNVSLWIKFRSGEENQSKGFKAQYALVHGGELSGMSGQIASPLYPQSFVKHGKFSWRITAKPYHVIRIVFTDLLTDAFDDNECVDEVIIYDGYDATAKILKRICGLTPPKPFTTGSNIVYIEFYANANPSGTKFLLDWIQVPRVRSDISEANKNNSCEVQVDLSLDKEKNNSYIIKSPGFPYGYDRNLICKWIIGTEPTNHLTLTFHTLDLENNRLCLSDYVNIYKGSSENEWDKIGTVCRKNDTALIFEGTNLMMVEFRSDYFYNRTGFQAEAKAVCGGSVSDPNGIIKSPDGVTFSPCQWNITAKAGQTIKVKFNKFNFPKLQGESCKIHYILFRDGGSKDSPILGAGRYCGEEIPDVPKTNSNKLFIQSTPTVVGIQMSSFELEYEAVSLSCEHDIYLNQQNPYFVISSPNYPNIPSAHIQCTWRIMAPNGETIHFDILERFDLTYHPSCAKEYLELREGNTELGRLIRRYCNTPPSYILTEGNALFVKYFTDVDEPRDGFKANVSLSKCGGTIFSGHGKRIQSPGYPNAYEGNLTCIWRLIGTNYMAYTLNFEKFDLGPTVLKHDKDACDDNIEDVLTISDVFPGDVSPNNTRTFCGRTNPETVLSDSNIVVITFKSQLQQPYNSKRGFSINISWQPPKCGGRLDLSEGEIKSPDYPYSRRYVHCVWRITVPKGRRVTFSVVDFDLKGTDNNLTNYSPQMVSFYSDHRFKTRIDKWTGFKEQGTSVESTGNKMLIFYSSRIPTNHRGFIGNFSSLLPAKCGGDLKGTNGTIYLTDLFNSEPALYCEWDYKNELNDIATFTVYFSGVINSKKSEDDECELTSTKLTMTSGDETEVFGEFCTKTPANMPYIITSPFPTNKITAVKSSFFETLGGSSNLTFSYKTNQCGGIWRGNTKYLTSPGYPNKYLPNLDCAWFIEFDEGSIIKVSFNSFNLETDCSKDYLRIFNGVNEKAAELGNYCGNIVPSDLISVSNALWFTFHSNDQIESTGFNISLTPVESGCGGIHHGDSGTIYSFNYPSPYTNNLECDWEIRTDTGFHINLSFVGRFFIEDSFNCTNDYLEISDYVGDKWKVLGRVCGRSVPQSYNSTSHRMRLFLKTNDKVVGDGFQAQWTSTCGEVIKVQRKGYLFSPGYPRNYRGPLDCTYVIDFSTTKLVTGRFEQFELEEESSSGCTYDKLEIYTRNRGIMYRKVGTYCGNITPPQFYSRGSFKIHFVADQWTNRKGYILNYFLPECGGDITEETTIVAPVPLTREMYSAPFDCVWNITAPKNKIISFKISSQLRASRRCSVESITIWDGPKALRDNNTNLIATVCGDLIFQPGLFRTKGNQAVFEFKSHNYYFSDRKKFNATVMFTYGETVGCGGTFTLRPPMPLIITNPKINGDDSPALDCHWNIEAPNGNSVLLDLNLINIGIDCIQNENNKTSCKCQDDFIQFFDGPSVNNELITTYCGFVQSPGQSIISSGRFISIRFVNDGYGNNSVFSIQAKAVPSQCGITLLNVTGTQQVLTSPNYPNNYPNNVHCKWILVHPMWATFDIHVEKVDIEPSDTCSNDRLEIVDLSGASRFQSPDWTGLYDNKKLIVSVDDRLRNPSIYEGSRLSRGISKFCGKGESMDYYSFSNRIQISFMSDSQNTAPGFKINYSTANCSRNYTAPQGRINQSRLKSNCTIFITSPNENNTIAMYFSDMAIAIRADCYLAKLEIYDIANSTTKPASTVCGYRAPNPFFSTGSVVKLQYSSREYRISSFDLIYTTTDQGRGCGGRLFNYGGIFTSPFFPNNIRQSSSCRWDITVPVGNTVVIQFQDFDIGPSSTCDTDYLTIFDYYEETGVSIERVTYCGDVKPARFDGVTNSASVVYKTSIHNGGTGWLARFMAKGPDRPQL